MEAVSEDELDDDEEAVSDESDAPTELVTARSSRRSPPNLNNDFTVQDAVVPWKSRPR